MAHWSKDERFGTETLGQVERMQIASDAIGRLLNRHVPVLKRRIFEISDDEPAAILLPDLAQGARSALHLALRLRAQVSMLNESVADGPSAGSSDVVEAIEYSGLWGFEDVLIYGGHKEVHLGLLQRYFAQPVATEMSETLFRALIAIPEVKDVLVRENHGVWGWHYHYCKPDMDRSDTVLCFDGRESSSATPLCWESHGAGKAKFLARPRAWAQRKRKSIYTACEPDLHRWPLSAFKKPGKSAGIVWPI